ncbi:MAG: SIS domain-containing protein [Clostridia bacterium]|nr:SIS domain-containing protein [Clostridia bacterium]
MKTYLKYIENFKNVVEKIETKEAPNIEKAAKLFSDTLMAGKKIFLFGTGHSHMLSEELFYRAGGLVNIQPVLVEPLMLHISASQSTLEERIEGYAERIFADYGMCEGDTIIIISNSGRNGVVVDMALLCKEKGLNVICLTNLEHTYAGQSRHKSGKRLCEIADIVLDNCGCVGDACVEVEGVEGKICPTSTSAGALILNAIVAEAVDICAKKGFVVEHFASSNVDGGDEINNRLIEKYKKEIKHL